MRGDRSEDAFVRGIGSSEGDGRAPRNRALLRQPFNHGVVHGGEDRILRYSGNGVMERHVGAHEGFVIADCLSIFLKRRSQILDVLFRRPLRSQARETDLEKRSRFLKPLNASLLRKQQPRGAGKLVDEHVCRRRGDACALAAPNRDEPHFPQREHRLAHRGAADAELFHDVLLGRQLIARRETAFVDHFLDALRDVLVKLATLDWALAAGD